MPLSLSARARTVAALGFTWLTSSAAALAAEPTKNECIDANETAQSLRKTDHLREAEERLLVCVAPSCPGPVRDDCAQRLTEVRSVTPTIVFVVKGDADQDLGAVRVTMDGAPLVDRLDGTAIALNPGQHRFVFEAEGRTTEERALLVREGEKDRHERIVLVALPVAAPGPTPGSPPVVLEPAPAADGHTQRIAGIAVGAAGAVGVVIGSVFGLVAKSTYDHAFKTECGGNATACDTAQSGPADGRTASSQATVSTVAFVAGGVLLGGGALLYFTAPKGSSVTVAPTVGAGDLGLAVRGRWW
jgi:hypothetical protein